MKKSIMYFILTAALLCGLTACGGNSTNDADSNSADTDNTPANIETPELFPFDDVSVSVPYYEAVKEKLYSSTYEYSNFVYDDSGRLIQKECSGDSNYVIDYVYDENGRLIETTETSTYLTSKGDQDIYTYTYDEMGNIATSTEKNVKADGTPGFRDGNTWEYKYEYDDSGRIIKESYSNTSADYPNETVLEYEYDESGRVTQEKETNYRDNEKKSEYVTTPTYDEHGNKIKESVKDVIDGGGWSNSWEYEAVGAKEYSVANGYISSVDDWVAFEEVVGLPTPDSCIVAIDSNQSDSTGYMFGLPEGKEDSEVSCFIYTSILEEYCGFTLMADENGATFITKDGTKLATMTTDFDNAHCIMISFE